MAPVGFMGIREVTATMVVEGEMLLATGNQTVIRTPHLGVMLSLEDLVIAGGTVVTG
jgi:hypothetical protein